MARKGDPFPEGNDEVVSKGPCPNPKGCSTEYGFVTYADGHGTCFSCGFKKRPGGKTPSVVPVASFPPASGDSASETLQPGPGAFAPLAKRGLTTETLKRYGYFVAGHKGQKVHVAPYFDQQGDPAGQKIRTPSKDFMVLKAHPKAPSIGVCRLFGHHVYGDRFNRKVVITEGELDAMSVGQALDFKIACVSVNTGSKGAAKCLKENYLWLDRFEEIILWFDDDDPGRAATEECAKLFKVGKVRIAKVAGFKDASEVLQADKPGDIHSAIYMATGYRPPGIVNAADNEDDVTTPKEDDTTRWSFHWPWEDVEDMLGPIGPGQVTYHVAGTGIGKTTGVAEIEMNLVRQGCKIAHMGLEDTRRDVKLRFLTIHVSERLDIKQRADDEMLAFHREVFGNRLIELFDQETAEWSVEALLGYVRYCAKALDCQVVVIDPLSFIIAGIASETDERRALDKVSMDIAAMAKELGIHIQVSHHLRRPEGTAHEEGAATSLNEVRGSGGIANFASFVIGHERNQQAPGDTSLITQLRALKNRPRSLTGPMVNLKYSITTGRLLKTDEPFPGVSKGTKGTSRGGGFPAVQQSTDY